MGHACSKCYTESLNSLQNKPSSAKKDEENNYEVMKNIFVYKYLKFIFLLDLKYGRRR